MTATTPDCSPDPGPAPGPERRPERRLDAVLALVPPDARAIADVGYDHGRLLARLAVHAPAARLIGVERQPGLDGRFFATFGAELGPALDRVDLRLGDGLAALAPGEVDVVVCAGLGERTLTRWLALHAAGPAPAERLVLCPADFRGLLRPAAEALGFFVADERVAFEAGRYYEAIALERGPERHPEPLARRFGPRLFDRADPWLVPWLRDLERRFARAYRALAADPTRAGAAADPELLDVLMAVPRALELLGERPRWPLVSTDSTGGPSRGACRGSPAS